MWLNGDLESLAFDPDPELAAFIREALANRKYVDMMADATFPNGTVLNASI
jgi:hypothetical protein